MKYFTLFLILCILANAEDCKTGGDNHCAKCYNEERCGQKVSRCSCCEEGYIYESEIKCKCGAAGWSEMSDKKCVKCDEHCTSGCKTKGADKCDSSCQDGYKLENDKCNRLCSIEHCGVCNDKDTCKVCEAGYELKDSNKKCEKIDCSNNKATHCELCTDKTDEKQCIRCESGYEKESMGSDYKCKDLSVCETEYNDDCGTDTERFAYEKDKCYDTGSNKYVKYDGSKGCYYEDSKCTKRYQTIKTEEKLNSCTKIGEKWYKYKSDDCKVKEYTSDKCDGGSDVLDYKCIKNADNEYIQVAPGTPYVSYYEKDGCKWDDRVKVDDECEDMECKGGSGAVMNMIILAILIISFMI